LLLKKHHHRAAAPLEDLVKRLPTVEELEEEIIEKLSDVNNKSE